MEAIKWAGREVEVLPAIPPGWKIMEGATNHPRGYVWIHNNKSMFSSERRIGLMKIEKTTTQDN